jgi:cysteinyl-tRNA synthetase
MKIYLYNTLSRKKEEFKPIKKNQVGIYTCGPTVYDYAHIGNLRTYILSDILRRIFEFNGYKINQVTNITDIDDKTIKRSIKEKINLHNLTRKYEQAYLSDLQVLNIKQSTHFTRATEHIKQMVGLIQALIDKDFAYLSSDGSVYFSIKKFKKYGEFARLDIAGLKHGARVSSDEYEKESMGDFVLWKAWVPDDGENFYEPSFKINQKDIKIKGRPGWHIECSAMSKEYLGQPFDIHTGAVDLIFPHHQNEIAQSEAAFNKPLAHYWVHGEHLLVNNARMAKSAGNYYILNNLNNKKINPLAFRYLCLMTSYHSKLNFSWESLRSAQNTLDSIYKMASREYPKVDKKDEEEILQALNNDLDTPKALAILHLKNNYNLWLKFEPILGLGLKKAVTIIDKFTVDASLKSVKSILEARDEARENKNWKKADELRDELLKSGYKIEDTDKGSRLIKI